MIAQEKCPGHFEWSAFGASYPDTVCANSLKWADGWYPGDVLCDADDDFRPKDIPCPFCDPEGFIEHYWPSDEGFFLQWENTGDRCPAGTEVHFHDGKQLWWTATHPVRGEERILFMPEAEVYRS